MSYRTTVKFNLSGSAIAVPHTGYNTMPTQATVSADNAFGGQILLFSGTLFLIFSVILFSIKLLKHHHNKNKLVIKDTARSTLFSLLFCLFLACGLGSCFAVYNNNNTEAATFSFDVPPELEVVGNVGEFAHGCETLKLNTATEYGYSIYASIVDTTNFVKTDGGVAIPAVSADGVLSNNSWGLALKTTEATKESSWLSVPKYVDDTSGGVLVAKYDDATEAEQETTVCFGFLTDQTMTPGEYGAVIDFRVEVDERTTKAILGINGNLNFVFDQNTYLVGGTYTDNLGETTIASVYNVPKNAATVYDIDAADDDEIDFNHNNSILSANFDESFYDFKPISTSFWFWHDDDLQSVTNAENLNTTKIEDLSGMFAYAGSDVDSFSLSGLNAWETENVSDLSYMFQKAGQNASSFAIDSLSSWNTENVTDVEYMFRESGVGTLDLSGWDLHNITDMHWMFHKTGGNESSVALDLSNWNIPNVTTTQGMFWNVGENAESFSLDVSGWNTNKMSDMSYMFDSAGKYAETFNIVGIVEFNTSSVTDMRSMFSGAGRDADYEIDLRSWNVENVFYYSGFNSNVEDKVLAPFWVN